MISDMISRGSFVLIRRSLFTKSKEDAAKVLIADLSSTRELLYTGPVNSLVRRLQLSLTTGALGSALGAPLLLHYLTSGWAFGSQTFYCLSGIDV